MAKIHIVPETRHQNPEKIEQNSGVNKFLGQAVFCSIQAMSKASNSAKVLRHMHFQLNDMDKGCLPNCCNCNTSMLNLGNLAALVDKAFFPWRLKLLKFAREVSTVEMLAQDPKHGFKAVKELVVRNSDVKNHSKALCKKQYRTMVQSMLDSAAEEVHVVVMPKVIPTWFSVTLERFRQKNIKTKEKLALRNVLKVTAAHGGKLDDIEDKIKGNTQLACLVTTSTDGTSAPDQLATSYAAWKRGEKRK